MRRDNCHSCLFFKQLHIVIHFVHWCSATWQLANCDNCDSHGHAWFTLCNWFTVTTVLLILVSVTSAPGLQGIRIRGAGGGVGPAGKAKWQ